MATRGGHKNGHMATSGGHFYLMLCHCPLQCFWYSHLCNRKGISPIRSCSSYPQTFCFEVPGPSWNNNAEREGLVNKKLNVLYSFCRFLIFGFISELLANQNVHYWWSYSRVSLVSRTLGLDICLWQIKICYDLSRFCFAKLNVRLLCSTWSTTNRKMITHSTFWVEW